MPLEYGTSLEQLMNELTEDKLQQEPPRTVLEPEPESVSADTDPMGFEFDNVESVEPESPNIKNLSGLPDLIVGVIDIFAATIAEAWTKTDDKSKYRLTGSEKDELIRAWKMYLETSENVKISPSTMLLLTTGIIYAPKAITAMREHKFNKLQEQWEAVE